MIEREDLTGLWRRRSIVWPDARSDGETEVLWLQGPRLYADLRVPPGRPATAGAGCLRDLDRVQLRVMARQEGFFGHLDVANAVAYWHRLFDYRPDTGIADRGALTFEDGILVERGIDVPYVEHWQRDVGSRDAMALSLVTETGIPGCLVVAGDAFIYARGRAAALPAGATLEQLIDCASSLAAAQDVFDCEISFGRRYTDGLGDDWKILRSSHGFREGASLTPAIDDGRGLLSIADLSADGAPIRRVWRMTGFESSTGEPVTAWLAARGAHGAGGRRGAPPFLTTILPGVV